MSLRVRFDFFGVVGVPCLLAINFMIVIYDYWKDDSTKLISVGVDST